MLKHGVPNHTIKKCKSMCELSDCDNGVDKNGREDFHCKRNVSRTQSASSLEVTECEWESARAQLDSLRPSSDGHALLVLEHKIDRLSDMFQEQCRLLTTLKEDIRNSKAAVEQADQYQTDMLADFMKRTVFQSYIKEEDSDAGSETNSRARCLLDAIEARQGACMDRELRAALLSFLHSEVNFTKTQELKQNMVAATAESVRSVIGDCISRDVSSLILILQELKQHMVAATAESVRSVIGDCISRDVSSLYLPMLEHSHRRFVRQISRTVEDAFRELEENSASLSRSVYKISRSLRRSIERHQHILEAATDPQKSLTTSFKRTVEELLYKELRQWREKVLDVFAGMQGSSECSEPMALDSQPSSPLQPIEETSAIDQLMMGAAISQQIEAGAVDAAFERALNAADLSLVTAACRRGAAVAFAPACRLSQHVLLALLQQLSTDMLQDTQLKCKYLEDSIINLDLSNAVTRAHLPLVVGEVRKHLSKFLDSFPGHVAGNRIAMIIMTADNLLKQ